MHQSAVAAKPPARQIPAAQTRPHMERGIHHHVNQISPSPLNIKRLRGRDRKLFFVYIHRARRCPEKKRGLNCKSPLLGKGSHFSSLEVQGMCKVRDFLHPSSTWLAQTLLHRSVLECYILHHQQLPGCRYNLFCPTY